MKKVLAMFVVLASFASIEALACREGTRSTRCAPGIKYPVSKVNAQGTVNVKSDPRDESVLAITIEGAAAKAIYDDLAKDASNEIIDLGPGEKHIIGNNVTCTRTTLGGRGARVERTSCLMIMRNGVVLDGTAG